MNKIIDYIDIYHSFSN